MNGCLKGLLIACALMVLSLSTADAAKVIYPGASPCNGTLQNCIDQGVQSGDTVLIATTQVDEDINIEKSITLAPAPGFSTPVIGGSGTFRTVNVGQGPNGQTVDVRIMQLALVNANVQVYFYQGTGHSFRMMDSLILISGAHNPVSVTTNVTSSFRVERNQIIAGKYWGIDFNSNAGSGANVDSFIYGNRITASNQADSYGGINLNMYGSGSNHVRVVNNVIYNVSSNPFEGAIRANLLEFTNNDLHIFNNTIDDSLGNGLYVASPSFFSNSSIEFNNNIVSNIVSNWIQLPTGYLNLTVSFDHNTYYFAGTSGYGGYAPGGDNDNQNPMYFDPANADYRLYYLSPCIGAAVGQIDEIGFSDQLGWPRIVGSSPDRGAYESDGNPSSPLVIFSDKFDNGAVDPSYTYEKGSWSEDGQSLLGTSDRKASMFFPASATCISCKAHFRVKSSGMENAGVSPKMWVVLWYADKNNYIDLLIKPESNKAVLRQKVNGVIARKDKFDIVMQPFGGYSFDIEKSGILNVRKEDGTLIAIPLAGSFSGKFGFQAKGTYGYLSEFAIYN